MNSDSPRLRAAVLEVVDNQLTSGQPAETRATFERLRLKGHSAREAKRLIACVASCEIFDMMTTKTVFDTQRLVARRQRLPRMPWDEKAERDGGAFSA